MQRLRLAVATVVLGVLLPACLAAPAGAQTRAGTARLVTQALDGIGGRSAITGLRTFRLQTTGRTFIFDEGLRPDNTVTPASTFTQTLNAELRGSGDRLRADNVRTSQGAARTVSEVIKGRLGYITGVDANNAQPATTAMTSDRWAAVRREQQLLNPHLLLRDLIARPRLATTFPSTTINGRAHRLLVINDPVSPIRLYVDARTGRIDRLSTADHQYLRRDVRLIVDFSDWRFVRGGTGSNRVRVRFPRTVSIRLDGKVIHTETRIVDRRRTARRAPRASSSPPGSRRATRRDARRPRRGDDRVAHVVRPGRVPEGRAGRPDRPACRRAGQHADPGHPEQLDDRGAVQRRRGRRGRAERLPRRGADPLHPADVSGQADALRDREPPPRRPRGRDAAVRRARRDRRHRRRRGAAVPPRLLEPQLANCSPTASTANRARRRSTPWARAGS